MNESARPSCVAPAAFDHTATSSDGDITHAADVSARSVSSSAIAASLNDQVMTFLHDLDGDTLCDALDRPVEQADGAFIDPWPMSSWPDLPTTVIACSKDRLFPHEFMQRVAAGLPPPDLSSGKPRTNWLERSDASRTTS